MLVWNEDASISNEKEQRIETRTRWAEPTTGRFSATEQFGRGAEDGKSYAPPVSGVELSSARVGATLGRPVNAVGWFFLRVFSFFVFLVLLFSSGF
jgi:hypothetical protein